MTIDSMPWRCRSLASIRPAGPAPIMPTCVRMTWFLSNKFDVPYRRGLSRTQRDEARKTLDNCLKSRASRRSAWPAVTGDLSAIVSVAVSKLRFEVPFFAPDHTEMQNDYEYDGHHQHPIGSERDSQPSQKKGPAYIHWVTQPCENSIRNQRSRWSPRLDASAGRSEGEIGGKGQRESRADERRTDHNNAGHR